MSKRNIVHKRIIVHGEKLNKIFDTHMEPMALCKKLRRLEYSATRNSEQFCNGERGEVKYNRVLEELLDKLDKALGFRKKKIPVFINSDPRGYALKIKSEWFGTQDIDLDRDWGGYGLLAPDLSFEN